MAAVMNALSIQRWMAAVMNALSIQRRHAFLTCGVGSLKFDEGAWNMLAVAVIC